MGKSLENRARKGRAATGRRLKGRCSTNCAAEGLVVEKSFSRGGETPGAFATPGTALSETRKTSRETF